MPSGSKSQGSLGSLIGSQLGGYDVEALIGRGAMGSVYLARDTKLNRHVALKVLLGSLAHTPSIVKQFRAEAQAAAPLNHPNIVRIYSAGMESGTPYIAMEFVDGEPLDRFLARHGKIQWDVALHIGAQVAAALDCAHRHGIVHRDVKPSNILVDRRGGVRLTDFGIARMQSEGAAAGVAVIGTPQYMSPEQVAGVDVGPSSDLFSLGVTMYQMIAGELPFRGESSMALVKSICEDDPPRLNRLISSVPDDVARLVAYLIEKNPAGRPASAKVAYGLIHRLQKQRGVATTVVDSITAFLKEEMEPRPFSSLERKRVEERKTRRRVERKTSAGKRYGWIAAHAVLVLALAAGAFMLGPLAERRARLAPVDPAREIGLADARQVSPGIQRITIYADGFGVRDMAWAGDSEFLVLRMRGQRGRLTDGESGVIAIDAQSLRVLNLVPPFRRGYDAIVKPAGVAGVGLPYSGSSASSPFARAVPVLVAGPRPDSIVLLALDVASSAPDPKIHFETGVARAVSMAAATELSSASSIAIHPDGRRACLVLHDPGDDRPYLVERVFDEFPLDSTSTRRTSPSAQIVPGSIQYTPDGRRIGYLIRTRAGENVLKLLNSGEVQRDGQDIIAPVADAAYAFSPESDRVVVALDVGETTPRVALVDLRLREVVRNLGPGYVSRQAWLPGREAFVYVGHRSVADRDRDPAPQLILVDALRAEAPMQVVTRLAGGVGRSYAVQGNGSRVAVESAGSNAGVYLIDLPALSESGGKPDTDE